MPNTVRDLLVIGASSFLVDEVLFYGDALCWLFFGRFGCGGIIGFFKTKFGANEGDIMGLTNKRVSSILSLGLREKRVVISNHCLMQIGCINFTFIVLCTLVCF